MLDHDRDGDHRSGAWLRPGLHLVVSDIEAARAELVDRGVDVSEFGISIRELGSEPGPDPERRDYGSFLSFSDPDGNSWVVQEVSEASRCRSPGGRTELGRWSGVPTPPPTRGMLMAHTRGGALVDVAELVDELISICGHDGVVSDAVARRTYESDGLLQYKVQPGAVVLPTTTEQVSRVVSLCHRNEIPWVARGSGTGLSGGALPVADGVLIVMLRVCERFSRSI